ncbi:SHOCT domain-containing protein [uncultured Polaribacter sp.]|uniref:SHOCT domain-containing protein n=1 Tax=uncultured Polaribacter sp. TaxID=174711 RepID=UPI00263352A6|nr:SHOCT domain-containing protein [uncultured Polaribacter sp.]
MKLVFSLNIFSDIILAIISILVFLIILGGIPLLISKIFNINVINRSGEIIAKPHYLKDISSNLAEKYSLILKKIKLNSKKDFSLIFNSMSNKLVKLEKLNELKEKKVITQNEFEILKKEILKK